MTCLMMTPTRSWMFRRCPKRRTVDAPMQLANRVAQSVQTFLVARQGRHAVFFPQNLMQNFETSVVKKRGRKRQKISEKRRLARARMSKLFDVRCCGSLPNKLGNWPRDVKRFECSLVLILLAPNLAGLGIDSRERRFCHRCRHRLLGNGWVFWVATHVHNP